MNEPPEHVKARGLHIQEALDAGMPRDLLVLLVEARGVWRRGGVVRVDGMLREALARPAARLVDQVFWQAMKRNR